MSEYVGPLLFLDTNELSQYGVKICTTTRSPDDDSAIDLLMAPEA